MTHIVKWKINENHKIDIVDFPMNSMVIFHMLNYQRVIHVYESTGWMKNSIQHSILLGNMNLMFPCIGNFIIPNDFPSFSEGLKPPAQS